ncbi:unnamed protein product [Cercospora beticola]|nr:unnamed protein product [Cercospora beticola]
MGPLGTGLGIDEEERTTLSFLKGNGRTRGRWTMEGRGLDLRLAHFCTGMDRWNFWAEVRGIDEEERTTLSFLKGNGRTRLGGDGHWKED